MSSFKAITQLVPEKKIFKGFNIHGQGSHIGHVIMLIHLIMTNDIKNVMKAIDKYIKKCFIIRGLKFVSKWYLILQSKPLFVYSVTDANFIKHVHEYCVCMCVSVWKGLFIMYLLLYVIDLPITHMRVYLSNKFYFSLFYSYERLR